MFSLRTLLVKSPMNVEFTRPAVRSRVIIHSRTVRLFKFQSIRIVRRLNGTVPRYVARFCFGEPCVRFKKRPSRQWSLTHLDFFLSLSHFFFYFLHSALYIASPARVEICCHAYITGFAKPASVSVCLHITNFLFLQIVELFFPSCIAIVNNYAADFYALTMDTGVLNFEQCTRICKSIGNIGSKVDAATFNLQI